MCFTHDGHLITVDHQIPIGCNTFLWAARASSHDATAINCSIKIFSLAWKWSISKDFSLEYFFSSAIIFHKSFIAIANRYTHGRCYGHCSIQGPIYISCMCIMLAMECNSMLLSSYMPYKRHNLHERIISWFIGFHPNFGKTSTVFASSVLKVCCLLCDC